MAGSTTDEETFERANDREAVSPITLRVFLTGIVGGVAGLFAMLPVAVGVPALLGLFELGDPAGFAVMIGAEPSVASGVAFFILGGSIVLPLFFAVTGDFLPPKNPPYVRGVTIATIFWPGFVIGFWPTGDTTVALAFLVFSLAGHWVYGFVLGNTMHRLTGIPEHDI